MVFTRVDQREVMDSGQQGTVINKQQIGADCDVVIRSTEKENDSTTTSADNVQEEPHDPQQALVLLSHFSQPPTLVGLHRKERPKLPKNEFDIFKLYFIL